MAHTDTNENIHRTAWREMARTLTQREILYYISGSPDGVRESKIKTFMHDVFRYSFQGSITTHLEQLASDGLVTKETTRSGAAIWHAEPQKVMNLIENELEEMKHHERELHDLHVFLKNTYLD